MALDPVNARYYVDIPSYRYSRILYPVLVRGLSLFNPDWMPSMLLLVNLVAIVLGTWVVAAWCLEHGLSAWWGLVFAFYVGQVVSFTRDLNEPIAYGLVAVAVYVFERWPERRLWSAVAFALAGLGARPR